MNTLNRILDRLLYWFLGCFYIFALTLNFKELLWYEVTIRQLILWTVVMAFAYMLISWNKWTFMFTGILLVLMTLIGVLWLKNTEALSGIQLEINRLIQIYSPAIAFSNGVVPEYQPPVIMAFMLIITVFYDLLAIKGRALGILTLIGLGLMALNNEFGTLSSRYLVFVLMGVQMLIYFMNMMKKQKINGIYKQWKVLLVFTGLFITSVFLLSNTFKDPLAFLESYKDIEMLERRGNESDQKLIYANSERLVDGVHSGNTVVLSVESPVDVYLRGTVLSNFDGMTWYSKLAGNMGAFYNASDVDNVINGFNGDGSLNLIATGDFDFIEMSTLPDQAYIDNNPSILEDYVDGAVSVTYKGLYTEVLFTPINYYKIFAEDFQFTINDDGFVISTSRIETDYQFTANYLMPLYGSESIIDLMRGQGNPNLLMDYMDELNQAVLDMDGPADWFYQVYLSPYLEMPNSITDRTKALAASLTEGLDNDYDKAKAIESYLKSNYGYKQINLTLPESGGDFVDYFLFETNEGYCTYFATAMAMMLRSEGIPARLVKGYVASRGGNVAGSEEMAGIPDFESRQESSSNTILVRDKDAHAWVEAYMEGFGWVPFEPTSGYRLYSDVSEVNSEDLTEVEEEEESVEKPLKEVSPTSESVNTRVAMITSILLLLLLPLITYLILRKFYRYKYKGNSIKESIGWHEFFVRKMLVDLYRGKADFETLKIYYQQAALTPDLDALDFEGYYVLLEKSYYSAEQLEINDYDRSRFFYEGVLRVYKEKRFFKYCYLKLRYMI